MSSQGLVAIISNRFLQKLESVALKNLISYHRGIRQQQIRGRMNEKTIQFLEDHIPEIAQAAVTQAYWMALASGYKVMQVEGDKLIEISPDGTKRIVKSLTPTTSIKIGQKLKIE